MKTLVALSGGVDSCCALIQSLEQGNDCYGITMKLHSERDVTENGCLTTKDIEDARAFCQKLSVPYEVVDFSEDFYHYVIENFISAYENGYTPNPCIECNFHLKFDKLYQYGRQMGFEQIATGHYARIEYSDKYGRLVLKKAKDEKKDQSYVLYRLSAEMLNHTIFPLGNLTKDEARAIVLQNNIELGNKKESQDICFIPDGDYRSFIEKTTGKTYPFGDFVRLCDGKVLGTHHGIIGYTIGQRKGLGLALDHSLYVVQKDLENNRVILGENEDLFSKELRADHLYFSAVDTLSSPMRVKAKIRYNQAEQDAVAQIKNGFLQVVFDKPQRAVCKGQSVVLYDDDIVLGGGIIC